MKLTIWREGDHAFFDWSGTDPQALGPINFYLSEGMFKMFIGIYLIMVNDPQILFNDGFYPLLHVVMPEGSLLRPRFPAALGCRTHALARLFDVLGGALVKQAPELNTAAGYGTSPYMLYSGWDAKGEFFYSMEILYGGIPGRPIGDGMDGHSWWPLFENIPTEYLEAYYPLRIDGYTTVTDSGGAGFHRGGNGVEKRYVYLEPGEVSIHDDRWLTRPWGVLGGRAGRTLGEDPAARRRHARSGCRRSATTSRSSPATCSSTARRAAAAGRTGSTGPSRPSCATSPSGSSRARRRRRATASSLNDDGTRRRGRDRGRACAPARGARRGAVVRLRPAARGGARALQGGDRPRAADAGDAAALVAARAGRRGARPRARGRRHAGAGGIVRHAGFHGRAGFGARPALLVVDVSLGFTDPASPLVCDLDDVVAAIARLLGEARRAGDSRSSSRPSPTTRATGARRPRSSTRCRRCSRSRPGSRWVEIDPRIAPLSGRAGADQALRVGVLRDAAGVVPAPPTGCDTVIVTGASTSGCVRATAVDALQHGYRRSCRARRSATATRPRTRRTCTTSTRSTATSSRSTRSSRTWRRSLGHTLAEKILLAHTDADDVAPGDVVMVRCDVVMANDVSGPIAFRALERMGVERVFDRERVVMVADHFAPAKDARSAELQRRLKEWSNEQGVTFYDQGRGGIEHTLLCEEGWVQPGTVIAGGDSHTCTYGALGAFGTGLGSTDIAACLALGEFWQAVPSTIRVEFTGDEAARSWPGRT